MSKKVKLHWLEGRSKGGYVTFGVPWKRGVVTDINSGSFRLDDASISEGYVQSKAIAYWEDGSVKWSSHTARIDKDTVEIKKTDENVNVSGICTEENDNEIFVDNGVFKAAFPKSGTVLMRTPYTDVSLKLLMEARSTEDGIEVKKNIPYSGEVATAEIEDVGAYKSIVKITGTHKAENGDKLIRFIVRFILHYNEKNVQIMHTFLFDGDEKTDFIKGIGIEFKRKMEGELYNRRIKIAGDYGIMHESMQILNLWRPRLGPSIGIQPVHSRQLAGEKIDIAELVDLRNGNPVTREEIDNVTKWDSYRLQQISPDSFEVKKRTGHEECTFIKANWGKRSKGLMYIADEKNGIAVCMRDFWQKYPSSIYADGLSGEEACVTAWIQPPDAEAIDFRHYDTVAHDQTYYEGFPEVGASAYGIANTNEMTLFMFDEVPSDERLMSLAEYVQKPPILVAAPEYYHDVKVMGEWSLPDRSTPLKAWLEDELDKAFDFYKNEIEQRHWYGLFDYGDIMHTYDAQRHCWKYDLGGYAWQNTELVPTLWLWYAFLRTGREDIFTVAEAMSRHAADVDTYHFGELKGLGSRHNVIHWGDSCKEPRVAMAGHHRALYFLMGGDLRMKDVFDDVKDADYSTLNMDPLRYFYNKDEAKMPTHARSGPDWSTYCSNWYTQWEITGDAKYKDKIITGINDLKKAPLRLISGSNFEYDPESGHLGYIGENAAGGSHLAICMGGPQTWFEIADCLGDDEFKDMLIEYGKFYFLPPEEKRKLSNNLIPGTGFVYPYMASAIVSYAAKYDNKEKLAYQVWQVLIHSLAGKDKKDNFDKTVLKNYFNNEKLDEMFWISTNFTAQWCLNTIFALELTKDYMKDNIEDYEWEDWVK
ncbi:MAG: hypothetical protein MR413_06470 [Clostridia bacterium]|nr:hypothetical protein [Clostridia bacterium]